MVSVLALPLPCKGSWPEQLHGKINKLYIFPTHLSSACGPSNWCCDAETAPSQECNSSASQQRVCLPRIVCAKQDEEKVNKLIIIGASCNAIGEAVKSLGTYLWFIILRIRLRICRLTSHMVLKIFLKIVQKNTPSFWTILISECILCCLFFFFSTSDHPGPYFSYRGRIFQEIAPFYCSHYK